MKMDDEEIATYVDMWLSLKPYINPKDKELACEKFLAVINENICDLSEVCDEWFGHDSTLPLPQRHRSTVAQRHGNRSRLHPTQRP